MMYRTRAGWAQLTLRVPLFVIAVGLTLSLAEPPPILTSAHTEAEEPSPHLIYLPLVERHQWVDAPLYNGNFEGATWHRTHTGITYDNILVPESWTAFWLEGSSGDREFGRPEMEVIPRQAPYLEPLRVYEGDHALKWFTFWRNGDVGVYQRIAAVDGAWYRARAYVHVWYSTEDPDPNKGIDPISQWRDDDGQVHPIVDGDPGMTAMIGVDPAGGTDPHAPTVIWQSANIYDQFAPLEVVTVARGQFVTLFLRTTTLYPFKHCDAYWDAVTLEVAR